MTKSLLEIARKTRDQFDKLWCESKLIDEPTTAETEAAFKGWRLAIATLSQPVADERKAFADAYQKFVTGQIGAEGFWKLAQQAAYAIIKSTIKESLTIAQEVETQKTDRCRHGLEFSQICDDCDNSASARAACDSRANPQFPIPQASGQQDWDAAIEAAAQWVDQRRFDFEKEHGCTDQATGALEFGRGQHAQLKEEYVGELAVIAEGIRALLKSQKGGGN